MPPFNDQPLEQAPAIIKMLSKEAPGPKSLQRSLLEMSGNVGTVIEALPRILKTKGAEMFGYVCLESHDVKVINMIPHQISLNPLLDGIRMLREEARRQPLPFYLIDDQFRQSMGFGVADPFIRGAYMGASGLIRVTSHWGQNHPDRGQLKIEASNLKFAGEIAGLELELSGALYEGASRLVGEDNMVVAMNARKSSYTSPNFDSGLHACEYGLRAIRQQGFKSFDELNRLADHFCLD